MLFHLVVLRPFAGYSRGDLITDATAIEDILAGPQKNFIVRIMQKEG